MADQQTVVSKLEEALGNMTTEQAFEFLGNLAILCETKIEIMEQRGLLVRSDDGLLEPATETD
jgi:hypothetical protein